MDFERKALIKEPEEYPIGTIFEKYILEGSHWVFVGPSNSPFRDPSMMFACSLGALVDIADPNTGNGTSGDLPDPLIAAGQIRGVGNAQAYIDEMAQFALIGFDLGRPSILPQGSGIFHIPVKPDGIVDHSTLQFLLQYGHMHSRERFQNVTTRAFAAYRESLAPGKTLLLQANLPAMIDYETEISDIEARDIVMDQLRDAGFAPMHMIVNDVIYIPIPEFVKYTKYWNNEPITIDGIESTLHDLAIMQSDYSCALKLVPKYRCKDLFICTAR